MQCEILNLNQRFKLKYEAAFLNERRRHRNSHKRSLLTLLTLNGFFSFTPLICLPFRLSNKRHYIRYIRYTFHGNITLTKRINIRNVKL